VAANLTLLFAGAAMLERPAMAAAAGFDGVEVLFPYDHPPAAWAAALAGLPVALINTPPGDWAAGERGWAAVPGAAARFRDGFARARDWAAAMGAARIHVMAGNAAGAEAAATFRRNLEWAAGFGLPLTVEPLNPADMPGYFLCDFAQAAAVLDDLAGSGIGLQFDLWHAARLGGVAPLWAAHRHRVAHVQAAGEPDRGEPGPAETAWLAGSGWTGWVGAEYRPRGDTAGGAGWLADLRADLRADPRAALHVAAAPG
jgi:hydroxypyruvate isomerase